MRKKKKLMMKNKRIIKNFIIVSLLMFFGICFAKSKTALSLYSLGIEKEEMGDWYSASQYFIEVTDKNPAFSQAWLHLAECSYRLGEYNLAMQYLTEAEKFEKNNPSLQNLKGMVNLSLGKIEDAKQIFNEVLKKYPNDVDSHFGLAEIELYDGKFSGAEQQYAEALKRQSTNRRAILSLALICAQTGKFAQAEAFLSQAMQYYSGETEVHYLSSVIYLMEGNYPLSEQQARIAIEIDGKNEKAYQLLTTTLYYQGRYREVIDLSDFLISRNRSNTAAWYIKGIALLKLGDTEEALDTLETGLSIDPQDELMRFQLELTARNNLSLNDKRRENWAQYHLENAVQYESRYDRAGSTYEYQRALLLDPVNKNARLSYANILELNGMHELYLNQLNFVKNNEGKLSTGFEDIIEAYNSLLEDTLAKQWNVDSFYLDKTRWNIAVFYTENPSSFHHADSERLTAQAAGDVFSGIPVTSVKTQVTPVSGYGEAFRNARNNDFDYFVIVSLSEGSEDLTLNSSMYNARTGTEIKKDSFYATGNNRYSTVLRRFRNSVLDSLTVKGKILSRKGKTVLVDLGRSENISDGAEFKIIKKGKLKTADFGTGLFYSDDDVTGELVISKSGEEVSEAQITQHGFYDRINVGDEVVLIKAGQQQADSGTGTVPNADNSGNEIVSTAVSSGQNLVEEIRKSVERPAILELLRNIY